MTGAALDLTDAVIMAVDDEPTNLALLESILEREGYRHVHLVDDPRVVMGTFEQVEPDLVLLDLQMPHVDGFELLDRLGDVLAADTFLPVLVLTADPTLATRRRALTQGATDFMTKPLDTSEVRLRVRNLLHTRLLHRQLEREKRSLEDRVEQRTSALRKANEALVAADQIRADFVAMASHEMRTPLTVIKGVSETLRHRWEAIDVDSRDLQLAAMSRNVDRLERLINNLLLAARIDTAAEEDQGIAEVRTAEVDLADQLERTIAANSLLRSIDVELRCPPGERARVDAVLLDQILDNLLSNAAKYGQPPVEVHVATDEDVLEVVVRDHGTGIPEEFVPQLFERFTQASAGDRRTAIGAGLGLWVARGLARFHGGDVQYEDAAPGSRFRVTLSQSPGDLAPSTGGRR